MGIDRIFGLVNSFVKAFPASDQKTRLRWLIDMGKYCYGSLIWKPPPFVTGRVPCYVKGYTRRFAQLSHDHRGTPENPGLVVTLVPNSEWLKLAGAETYPCSYVWGVMYTIEPSHTGEVKRYLDEREKDGYELMEVDVFVVEDGQERWYGKSSIYVGHTTNPSFCRPPTHDQLAAQIYRSVGPSGPNKEYLYHLKREVEALCPDANDPYLRDLECLVKQLDQVSHS